MTTKTTNTKPAGSHSPTPWYVGASGAMVYDALGVPASNCVIRETELGESGVSLASNAALIVSAVNSHAELVEALRDVMFYRAYSSNAADQAAQERARALLARLEAK